METQRVRLSAAILAQAIGEQGAPPCLKCVSTTALLWTTVDRSNGGLPPSRPTPFKRHAAPPLCLGSATRSRPPFGPPSVAIAASPLLADAADMASVAEIKASTKEQKHDFASSAEEEVAAMKRELAKELRAEPRVFAQQEIAKIPDEGFRE